MELANNIKKFYLGHYLIDPPLVLAPMAGLTNLPFRSLCRMHGAGLVVSEMVSANGLVQNSSKTFELLKSDKYEYPFSIQIFGSSPEIMAGAAKILEKNGAMIIDINMGCPVKKVVKNGAGAALLNDLIRAKELISAVADEVSIPVTVKMRVGWNNPEACLELSRYAEASGAAAVAVHGRTAVQKFSGTANWSVIEQVAGEVDIPVIGNGDINDIHDAATMLVNSKCAGLMIGRAALGNPWIFGQITSLLNKRTPVYPDYEEIFMTMTSHINHLESVFGPERTVKMARTVLPWYVKGFKNVKKFRCNLNMTQSIYDILKLIKEYKKITGDSVDADYIS